VAKVNQNEVLFERAQKTIPGGVNSPVRAFRQVGGTPRFVTKAKGPYFWDAENKRYIDLIMSWGPMIVGHANPEVVEAVQKAAETSFSYGAPTEGEIELAERICAVMPSVEQVRMVSSGTEATMSALRLARGYTGRDLIIKFEGCYHGHADSLLVKAGSGLLTFADQTLDLATNAPSSGGVPQDLVKHTLVLPFNDLEALQAAFKQFGPQVAALIVEPIAGNMNLVQMTPEFIQAMRELTQKYGSVLIYDEVMTGFRVALGGICLAICAASIKNVPLPHIGSNNGISACQPVSAKIPAARFSLSGAAPFSSRHPLLNKASPEVSK
jgi:glutamate-1-semialdehyde 2,1-aminomutase